MAKMKTDVKPLAEWINEIEEQAQALGVVVVAASHPDATKGIHEGKYSGILLGVGDVRAQLSNGDYL